MLENVFIGTDVQTVVRLQGDLDLIVRTQNSDRGRAMIFEPGAEVLVDVEPGAERVLQD